MRRKKQTIETSRNSMKRGGDMRKLIITNNSFVYEKYNEKVELVDLNGYTYLQVLEYTRDKIHQGHKLLTHPLSGSVKPNETPFKSIVISKEQLDLDFEGLCIIEDSIASTKKFLENRPTPRCGEKIANDFRLIDLSLTENAINKMNGL